MKKMITPPAMRHLCLLLSLFTLCALAGCSCEGEVSVSGKILDATDGAPLDSVRVSLFYIDKKETHASDIEYPDSTGRFQFWDTGYCSDTRFFILASKPGYVSQTLDVESFSTDLEIRLKPD